MLILEKKTMSQNNNPSFPLKKLEKKNKLNPSKKKQGNHEDQSRNQ